MKKSGRGNCLIRIVDAGNVARVLASGYLSCKAVRPLREYRLFAFTGLGNQASLSSL